MWSKIVAIPIYVATQAVNHCRANLWTELLLAKGSTTFSVLKILPEPLPLLPE
jgi:hypothetical protein